jgi:hypothetical protein
MSAEPNTPRPLAWPNYGLVNVWTVQPQVSRQDGQQVPREKERSRPGSRRLWQALLLAIASQTGCAQFSPTTLASTELPPSLREPCPQLPRPLQGDSAYIFLWVRDLVALYNECATKHQLTVEALK